MRLQVTVSILAAIAWQGSAYPGLVAVDVYLSDRDDTSRLMGPGTSVASGIFAGIGIRLKWHAGDYAADPRRGPNGAGQTAFGIRTVEHARIRPLQSALASRPRASGHPARKLRSTKTGCGVFLPTIPL